MSLDAPGPDTPQLTAASSSRSSSPCEPRSEPDTNAMDVDEPPSQHAEVASSPSATLIVKRKATSDSKSSAPSKKKAKTDSSSLIELKNGRLVYKTKGLSLENQLAALKQRMELQEHLQNRNEPLKEWPEQHQGALAKIIHESEKSLLDLAKHAKSMLLPSVASSSTVNEDSEGDKPADLLPLDVLKKAIQNISKRINWGVSDAASVNLDIDLKNAPYHLPAGLCLWRWEVQDRTLVCNGLPSELAQKIEQRYSERVQVQTQALDLLKALPEPERIALFDKTVKGKKASASTNVAPPMENEGGDVEPQGSSQAQESSKSKSKAKQVDPEKERLKAEKAAEKKRKEEEKAAKAEEKAAKAAEKAKQAAEKAAQKAEKDKAKAAKEAAKAELEAAAVNKTKSLQKQAGAFMGFFKAAPEASASTSSPVRPVSTSTRDDSEEPRASDFDRAFKGFHCTKDVSCVYPSDYIKPASDLTNEQLINSNDSITCASVVAEIIGQTKPSDVPKYKPRPLTTNLVPVRSIMQNISEGDLTGSNSASYWRKMLRDPKKVPVKLMTFGATDRRPGYIGTWSKKSRIIRPRNPFAQDSMLFTYDYDSEEEWEEEDQNGDDVNSDDARSVNSDSESDSDEDGWLCDDDEVEFIDGFEGDDTEHQRDPEMAARNRAIAKRERSNKDAAARSKAPKALVPVSRGPVWEAECGKPLHSTFESMTICFLNDATPGLNPLTFVTKPAFTQASAAATAVTMGKSHESALASDPLSPEDAKKIAGTGKLPKKPFPSELYCSFVSAVTKSEASNKPELVVELSKAFPNVTKVAIEAELKEHVKKSKIAGLVSWTVSEGLKAKAENGSKDRMDVDA